MVAERTTEAGGSPAAQGVRPRCGACGQMVPSTARECPFCGRGLMVDLVVDGAVDGRRAARLAGELAAAARRGSDEVGRRLAEAPGAFLDGLSRAEALACQEILEREGLASRVVPGRQSPPGRSARSADHRAAKPLLSRPGLVLAWKLTALGLVAAAAVWWFARPDRAPTGGADRERPLGFARRASDQGRVWVEPEGVGRGLARLAVGFVAADHRLITSARVAGEVGERVRVDGRTWGRVAAVDEWLGVAVVDLSEAGGKVLVLGESGGVQSGDRLRLPGTAAAEGLVVRYPSRFLGLAWIEVDAQVAETDSGGPVLGPAGEVVGVLQRFPERTAPGLWSCPSSTSSPARRRC